MDVYLGAGTYPDLTTAAADDTFTLDEDYHPVVYTLKQNDVEIASGTLSDVVTRLQNISKNYAPNTNLSTLLGTYKLSWKWDFNGNDKADTLLGNMAAENGRVPGVDPTTHYSTYIAFNLEATVTQID